jgi:hypothetical protein
MYTFITRSIGINSTPNVRRMGVVDAGCIANKILGYSPTTLSDYRIGITIGGGITIQPISIAMMISSQDLGAS